MAAALLMLVLNTQRSSGREAGRTRAFHVAEAALDVGMMELSKAWPADAGAPFAFSDESYRSAFRETFDESEFPDPRAGGASFVSVQVIDDENPANHYDYGPNGPNGRLIVDAQAVVGTSSARIRALVQANYYPVPIAPDTGGHGEKGLGRKTEGGAPSPNIAVFQIYRRSADPNQMVYFSSNAALPDPSLGALGMSRDETRENILPTTAIEDIVQLAKDKNRYFGQDADQPHVSPDGSEHTYSAASSAWAAAQQEYGLTGLIVVDRHRPDAATRAG